VRDATALDRALLAAAHARAEGGGTTGDAETAWIGMPEAPAIETWVVAPDDDRIPPRIHARAASGEAPLVKDMGERRLALVPARSADGAVTVVAAMAPAVRAAASVGWFAAVWIAASAVAVGFAAVALAVAVRAAFRPLDDARAEVARVVALGRGQRVRADGPVEVASLLEAVNALLDRLDAAHAVQVRFTAEAAHELRTPVAAMLGQVDVALRRERSPEAWRVAAEGLREDVLRLGRLVEAMTALARVDAGQIECGRERVRAAELAKAALEREGASLEAAACRVSLHVDDDPELEVHRALVELALANLLRNAARHASGSAVVVTVRATDDACAFEVRDDGVGVPPEAAARAFDRFVRGAGAREADPSGLGLGLPLAREVALRHGGDCTLREVATGGTRATLRVQRPG
jgi:signal transduction histidine kinase